MMPLRTHRRTVSTCTRYRAATSRHVSNSRPERWLDKTVPLLAVTAPVCWLEIPEYMCPALRQRNDVINREFTLTDVMSADTAPALVFRVDLSEVDHLPFQASPTRAAFVMNVHPPKAHRRHTATIPVFVVGDWAAVALDASDGRVNFVFDQHDSDVNSERPAAIKWATFNRRCDGFDLHTATPPCHVEVPSARTWRNNWRRRPLPSAR